MKLQKTKLFALLATFGLFVSGNSARALDCYEAEGCGVKHVTTIDVLPWDFADLPFFVKFILVSNVVLATAFYAALVVAFAAFLAGLISRAERKMYFRKAKIRFIVALCILVVALLAALMPGFMRFSFHPAFVNCFTQCFGGAPWYAYPFFFFTFY